MSTLRLTEQALRKAIADGQKSLTQLERDLDALFARAQPADGYPSGGGPGRTSGTSDPTARAAELRIDRDEHPSPAGRAIHRLWVGLVTIGHANSFRAEALPPEPEKHADDADWCTHCLSVTKHERGSEKIFSPRATSKDAPSGCTLCAWCYQFERANGLLPPVDLVRAHERGERITQQRVQQFLGDALSGKGTP